MTAYKYNIGDVIGPYKNKIINRRIRFLPSGAKLIEYIFTCSECDTGTFVSVPSKVISGKRHLCHDCVSKSSRLMKYKPGDIINDNLLIERLYEKHLSCSTQNAMFQCPDGHIFKGTVQGVVSGKVKCPICYPKTMPRKYQDGSYIGSHGIFLIKRTRKDKNGNWYALLRCHCGNEFEGKIAPIACDIVKSCGCLSKTGQFTKKFKKGDLLGPNKIEFLGYTGKKDSSGGLLGEFRCPHCGHSYITRVSRVSGGDGHTDCGCQEAKRREAVGKKNIKDNLAGKKYGRLTVIKRTDRVDPDGTYLWECECSCKDKTICYVSRSHLVSGNTKSCGCFNLETSAEAGRKNIKDISGQIFGYLEALYRDGTIIRGKSCPHTSATWTCKCHKCGRIVHNIVAEDLKNGNVISCGYCRATKGEKAIQAALDELDLSYDTEKTFETLCNPATESSLFFDFYLSEINVLIEYDGQQHFVPDTRMTVESFSAANNRDVFKNEWATQNKIPLIRIPYTSLSDISADFVQDLIDQAASIGENVFVPLSLGTPDERPIKF